MGFNFDYQLAYKMSLEEMKIEIKNDKNFPTEELFKSCMFEDFITYDLLKFMPMLENDGFFKYVGLELPFGTLIQCLDMPVNQIIDKDGQSIGFHKTLIWWLKTLKKYGVVYVNDNNEAQNGNHPFDVVCTFPIKTIGSDHRLLRIIAHFCPVKLETLEVGKISPKFQPRFGNPLHNLFAYWIANKHNININFLMNWGYTTNDKNSVGKSVLQIAAEHGNSDDMRILIKHGADVNYVYPKTGQTALHIWAFKGADPFILNSLKTADTINLRDNLGQTPLFYAIANKRTWERYEKTQSLRISYLFSKFLIEHGAEIDTMNNAGFNVKDVFKVIDGTYEELGKLLGVKFEKFHFDQYDDLFDDKGEILPGVTQARVDEFMRMQKIDADFRKSAENPIISKIMDYDPETENHERIDELMRLPDNWNGEGSEKIPFEVGNKIKDILNQLPIDIETPSIFPSASGGMTIEWYKFRKEEITIEVEKDLNVIYSYFNSENGAYSETEDFNVILELIKKSFPRKS